MQDNKRAVILEKWEKYSSKWTKHINTRYLFVQDKVAQVDLEIEHFPTESIWADILTNPFQGRAFREFRAELMNYPVDYEEEIKHNDGGNTLILSNTNTYL